MPDQTAAANGQTESKASAKWGVGSWLLLTAISVFLASTLFIGLKNSLCGHHGFRQTQNASAIVGFDQEGLSVSQILPSVGPPWRVFQELPVYQWSTFAMWKLIGCDLPIAGRLASIGWFIAALVMMWKLVGELADARTAWLTTILAATSPLYLFWSRSFMMESTAVATALAFGLGFRRFLLCGGAVNFLAAALLGSVAITVKPTSFMGGAVLVGLASLTNPPSQSGRWRMLLRSAAVASIVGAVFVAWSRHAQHTMQALILNDWLGKPEYSKWFTGELTDRVNPAKWSQIGEHLFPNLLGPPIWVVIFLAGIMLARGRSLLALVAISASAFPMLVFFNVYVVHDYYHYESAYLTIVAVAVVVAQLTHDQERGSRGLGWVMFVALVGCSLYGYSQYYLKIQRWNPTDFRDFARSVRDVTRTDDFLAVYGYNFSPEFAFYAERRCFQDIHNRLPESEVWQSALKTIPTNGIGGVVLFGKQRQDTNLLKSCRDVFRLQEKPVLSFKDELYNQYDADVYLPEPAPNPSPDKARTER